MIAARAAAWLVVSALTSPALADPDFEAAANAPRVVQAATARSGCLPDYADPIAERPCQLARFGTVGTFDGRTFDYVRYAFTTEGGGSMGGRVLLFERIGNNQLRILFVPENIGGPFSDPQFIKTPSKTLLLFPGYDTGTGNFNRERLYVRHKRAWRLADTASWLDALAKRLPKDLRALQGIYPDYRRMTAATPLWRPGSGKASPESGHASIRLAWRGDEVVLQSVSVRRR